MTTERNSPGAIGSTWIEHRRGDGERVGWIDLDVASPLAVPIDRLGRAHSPVADWGEAEETLEEIGLRFLADTFEWTDEDGAVVRVRIAELDDERVVLTTALSGAIGEPGRRIEISFPPSAGLRAI